ncbi:hypothetical protein Trydic_g5402 [Trypoxylus dichotomus]
MSETNSSCSTETWSKYAKYYNPLKIGSIDGTDIEPHDRAIVRAINSEYTSNKHVKVKDIVTGFPKGYAFIEYESEASAEEAYRGAYKMNIDGNIIFVDFECERLLKGWKPRRLGGGFGGNKESGQLRFGGRDRPFKKPISLQFVERDRGERTDDITKRRSSDRYKRTKPHTPDSEDDVQRRRISHKRHRSRSREQR